MFSPDEPDRYRGLVNSLRYHDHFLVCADFDDYYAAQRRIADLWRRPEDWWQAAILNTAMSAGSPRTARSANMPIEVWNVPTYTAAVTAGADAGPGVPAECARLSWEITRTAQTGDGLMAQRPGLHAPIVRDAMAYVLAGGRGSRLLELTDVRAKPAVYFGGKSRIIDFALSNALNSGIRRIGVATQYKAHSLIRHLQRGWNFFRPERNEGFDILPASQRSGDSWYAGTADALYQNIDIIEGYNPEYIVVLAGDHVYKMDYAPMLVQHVEQGADVTVGCIEVPRMEATGFGVMHVDDDRPHHRLRRKAGRSARHAGQPGHGAGQHGHLRLQHALPDRAAAPRRGRPDRPAATSARTSSRIW